VGSNPTQVMDVCLRVFRVCVVLFRHRPCDWLIPRPRSPTDCLRIKKLSETKRFADALCSKVGETGQRGRGGGERENKPVIRKRYKNWNRCKGRRLQIPVKCAKHSSRLDPSVLSLIANEEPIINVHKQIRLQAWPNEIAGAAFRNDFLMTCQM
jgi:hypothetical protein